MPDDPRRLPVVSSSEAVLPPLFARWIDELLDAPLAPENDATCGDCAMCPPLGARPEGGHFRPEVKCCSYSPALANFLVGAVLEDDAALARERVRERVARGIDATPLGIGRGARYGVLYDAALGGDAFGVSTSLRCPYFVDERGGLCGVWAHRESTCSTWFCKHVRGAVGHAQWRAVQKLLHAVERALARWCVLELELGDDALARLFEGEGAKRPLAARDLDETVDENDRRTAWGTWYGREEDFYRACARRVGALAWSDVLAIAGPEVAAFARLARRAHAAARGDALPARLRVGVHRVVATTPTTARVATYSANDALDLPLALLHALPAFDGGQTSASLARLAAEHGIELDPALVRRLVDFEILVPA